MIILMLIKYRDISNYCRDRNTPGCAKGFRQRILAAEQVVTPDKCRKYFVNMQRYIFTKIELEHIFILTLILLRFLDAYKDGATALDVVAKTRELKKRHRAPLVMPEEQRRRVYRRKRRIRGGDDVGEDEEGSGDGGSQAGEGGSEGEFVFDQDRFGEMLRNFLWKEGPGRVHLGFAHLGKLIPDKRAPPALNYFEPKLYFDDIAWQKRSSEIDEWLDENDESKWQRWMHDE